MASKPDKFGIKFWCLADTESKYLCNAFPYLGKDPLNLYFMNTMHPNERIDTSHLKKLQESIKYYNKSKVGVDIIDQMARYNTCKAGTRRWPVACFYNMLDLCAINAWILYKETIHAASY